MGIVMTVNKLEKLLNKYRYPILILLIGFILMAIPGKSRKTTVSESADISQISGATLEVRLSAVLSQVHGAGKVEVVLTPSAGEEVIYQTNQDSSNGDSSNHIKSDTVTITDSDRNQTGLIRQINPERYQGAIILCQGADDPAICLAIVDAVSKATGLGANKISVLKMK